MFPLDLVEVILMVGVTSEIRDVREKVDSLSTGNPP